MIAALIAAPFLGRAAVVAYNGAKDDTVASHERALVHKEVREGSESDSYHLHFDALPGMRDSAIDVTVDWDAYEPAEVGDVYVLKAGSGRLGVTWMASLDPR